MLMRHRLSLLVLIALIAAVVVPPTAPLPAQAQDLPWREKGSPFGIVAALANRVRSDEIPTAVQLMREAGVQWQREEFFWHEIQFEPGGAYRWGGNAEGFYNYDLAVTAQVDAGINLLGLLDYNPAWMKGKNPHPDEWINDWGAFVYNTVARYGRDRGQIKYWELWNEPNLAKSGYESGLYTIADFVRILEVGRAAALAADPEAKIILGGLASIWSEPPSPYHYDYFDYLDQVALLGGWQYVDIIAIHPYRPDAPEGDAWRRDQSLTFHEELTRLDGLLRAYGPKPVWLTEFGWSTNTVWPGVDEDTQAFFLIRSYIMAIAHPSIEKIFWYDFRNDTRPGAPYERPVYDSREVEFHYGLLRRSFPLDPNRADLRKPAFLAYRTMTQMLGGLTLREAVLTGQNPDWRGVHWYRFAGVGRRVDVLWRTAEAAPALTVDCGCREALVRNWNGSLRHILYSADGLLTLRPDTVGAPIFIEYDPPVASGGAFFSATDHSLRGAFQRFWNANGGLEVFGYPLTEELIEPEVGSGRPRTVQYFERARFEHFPEFSGTPYEVQLTRLGDTALRQQGIAWETLPRAADAPPECRFFPETGKRLCPPFTDAWERAGGLALVGLPLTDAYPVIDEARGTSYTVQYFERTRIEDHGGAMRYGLLGSELLTRWGGMP